jgi:hypothetical protein
VNTLFIRKFALTIFCALCVIASVTIPDSVRTIRNDAFYNCTSLTTVTISPVQRDWRDYVFSTCPKLSLASQAALRAAGYEGGF